MRYSVVPLTVTVLLVLTVAAHAQVRGSVDGNTHPPHYVAPDPASVDELVHLDAHDDAADAVDDAAQAAQHADFMAAVNLEPLRTLAVFDRGRAKILDTYAREMLTTLAGTERYRDVRIAGDGSAELGLRQDHLFTLLDLMLYRSRYHHQPIVRIDVLPLRRALVEAVIPPAAREAYLRLGRLTPMQLADPRVESIIAATAGDLRLAKGVDQIMIAGQLYDGPALSLGALPLVSPPSPQGKWLSLAQLHDTTLASAGHTPAPGFDPQLARQAVAQVDVLSAAWRATDAPAVNAAVARLADLLPRVNPETYPASLRRYAELWYNRTGKFTVGFWAYFLAAVLLLIALATGRHRLVALGSAALVLGVLLHTAGIVVRMILADRNWLPLHNQYESFVALAWFGVLVGLALMLLRRQLIFGPAAAALGAASLMVAGFLPIPSNEIAPVAGILATSNILKVHVTIVLASYGLIALGFLISLCLLAVHYLGDRASTTVAAAGLGVVALGDSDAAHLTGRSMASLTPSRQRLLADLDQAQMVVLQLAFYLLGVGILMGAYWADHAWGRWWAWDPKETWALITWIVYLIVIHLRFAVQRRALVTAWLSIVGFFVMLWTYWGVNLLLAGLHSYA